MLTISNKSLGAEGSMSEIGMPPPNNLDTTHTLVARNTHTQYVPDIEYIQGDKK